MSIQATLKINPSLKQKMQMVEKIAEDAVRDKLTAIATTAVQYSPVDTGAYVTSHSLQPSSRSYGRGYSSKGKPRGQDERAMKAEAMENLMGDIAKLDLEDMTKVTLRNDSPHAQAVEYKHGYAVYAKVRNIHG